MPRVYQRKLGARRYADYSAETLEDCLTAIKNGTLSQRKASLHYGIPRRTIINKLKNVHSQLPGPPPIFTKAEEDSFAAYVESMSAFGFPLTVTDLRYIIQIYLERTGRWVKKFKGNMPGSDWMKGFLKRNPQLNLRFAANIKRKRAALDRDTIVKYFENLKPVVDDVPPENLYNYDETNLTDDPGKKKVIVHRGAKYPENICNSSKSSTSIMMCGNAAGELIPPYVVYRSQHMWSTWTENGPKGCRYNHTTSGWFDSATFEDWFFSLVLPRLKKQRGKKVLIGDNLNSHISLPVLQRCREENIYFVCLPPNSTHMTQPLDVAFFHPLKVQWRRILTDWKETSEGLRQSVLPKDTFPRLLKELMEAISSKATETLKSGFRKCGIYPLNAAEVLERIPSPGDFHEAVDASFLEHLQVKRRESTGEKVAKKRRKRLDVPAGKSIAHEDTGINDNIPVINGNTRENAASSSKPLSKEKARTVVTSTGSDEESTDKMSLHSSSSNSDVAEFQAQVLHEAEEEHEEREADCPNFKEFERAVGVHVVFSYDNELYPGIIVDCNDKGATISAMSRSCKSWKWPPRKDEMFYEWDDIIGGINPPKLVSKRGFFSVPELDCLW